MWKTCALRNFDDHQVRSTRRSKVPQGRAKAELDAVLEQFSKMAAPAVSPPAQTPQSNRSNGKSTAGEPFLFVCPAESLSRA